LVRAALTERAERRLHSFVKQAWHVVEPANRFVDNWHIGCVCEHLEALTALEIRNLIINVPPRHAKSLLVAVFWFCWAWLRDPAGRWMFSSYGEDLSSRDSVKCRDIITSRWYQERWADRFRLKDDQNAKTWFANDRQGYRIATTVEGKATGHGGDYLVADDPHKVQEAHSRVKRQAVLDWWAQAMSTRGNDPKTVRKVVVMQRVHQGDLTGYLLAEQAGFEHLCLPAEYEPRRVFYSAPDRQALPRDAILATRLQRERPHLRDPRSGPGELLWPERFGPAELADLKKQLRAVGTAGQLQQRPAPAEGSVYRRGDFQYFTVDDSSDGPAFVLGVEEPGKPPPLRVPVARCRFFQCCDTALKVSESSAYTAVGTFAITPHKHLLVYHVWRERLLVPQQFNALMALREAPHELVNGRLARSGPDWPRPLLFQAVEDKASGIGLIQQGVAEGKPFKALKADGDKVERSGPVATLYANRMVWHRAGQPWLTDYEDELLSFPQGFWKDAADVTAYAGILVTHDKILSAGLEGPLLVSPEPPAIRVEQQVRGETVIIGDVEVYFPDDDLPWYAR
jgi:phage terminase large subunit-like protein